MIKESRNNEIRMTGAAARGLPAKELHKYGASGGKFPVFLAIGALSRVNGNKASTGCRPFHPEEPAPVPRFLGAC